MESNENKSIEKDELTGDTLISGHEYDDIKELDNRLPRWWLWLFILSVVWGVIYLFVFDVIKIAPHQLEEYENEMMNASSMQPADMRFDSTQVALLDQASIEAGKVIWDKNCVVCHLAMGQGKIGPNLCDTFAIHGCAMKDVLKVILTGVPEKGMISWKTQLSKEQILQVASYTMTLRGTTPPEPKEPQGDPCK